MEYTPSSIKELGQKQLEKNKQLVKFLKKKKPSQLDDVAQSAHEEVFEEIDCLTCANCCKTTGPLFTDKDITRIAKRLRLKEIDFRNQYLRLDEDNDWVFKTMPCPFLDAENYCSIYEDRPKACREYPHTDRKKFIQILDLTLTNTLICPAANKVMEKIAQQLLK
jgi:Fe-S-cluster containining protein